MAYDVHWRTLCLPKSKTQAWILEVLVVLLRRFHRLTTVCTKLAVTLADCEGAQPYLFEPYDSGASSCTDSINDSDQDQFERLQSTDW